MASNAELMQRRIQAIPQGVGNIHQIYADRAENGEVWDVEGKRFIDFASGIAVVNTGHRHPKIMAAVSEQMEKFTHTCFHAMPYESYIDVAEKLNEVTPGDHAKKTMLLSTGAEAVENAIKIARAATKRSAVIALNGAFHGRTMMAVSLTGKMVPYKKDFGPFPGEVFHAPYPNALHGISVDESIAGLEQLFKTDVDPERVAAIFIEPVQGEGGFYVAPPEYMQRLRALCDQYGILMIVDEIQTGVGRTGKLFAIEHSDVIPDLMTLAKGLAGGFPLSALVGRAEIMDAAQPGGVGGTYAGNPLACVAASAVFDIIEEENLLTRSQEIGQLMRDRLTALSTDYPVIGDVRGLGAMVAMELFTDETRQTPNPELTQALVKKAAEKGLILLSCGTYGNVIRILSPLTISNELVNEGIDIIADTLQILTQEQVVA